MLPQTLANVLPQLTDRVEIVICDNGSEDGTPQFVASFLENHPQTRAFRFEKNVGVDRCVMKAIEMAQGEYCWLLSDDDVIEAPGIQTVLEALNEHPHLSGISVNCKIYDLQLQHFLGLHPMLNHLHSDRLYVTEKSCLKDLFHYFGYMTGQIIRRDRWLEAIQATENIELYFNTLTIVLIMTRIIQTNPSWMFLFSVHVQYRSDNDSFQIGFGNYGRFLIDVVAYQAIARKLFGHFNALYYCCLGNVCKIHLQSRILQQRKNATKDFRLKAFRDMLPRYWRIYQFWIYNFPYLLLPNQMYFSFRRIYIGLRNRYRTVNR
jgi:abequosyltransferase